MDKLTLTQAANSPISQAWRASATIAGEPFASTAFPTVPAAINDLFRALNSAGDRTQLAFERAILAGLKRVERNFGADPEAGAD